MISVLDIAISSAGYNGGTALRDINVKVDAGELYGVLGANGSGKTTLLRAIAGLTPPSVQGTVRLEGRDISRLPAHDRPVLGIGHVPEGRRVFASLTVRENLLLGGYRRRDDRAAWLDRLLATFPELGRRQRQPAGSLSGGEQQMLSIGRALMGRPKLLLLDEPSLGLSPLVVHRVYELLRVLHSEWGLTLLLVEQNATEALDLITRACVLERGRVVAEGTAEQLHRTDSLAEAYLGFP